MLCLVKRKRCGLEVLRSAGVALTWTPFPDTPITVQWFTPVKGQPNAYSLMRAANRRWGVADEVPLTSVIGPVVLNVAEGGLHVLDDEQADFLREQEAAFNQHGAGAGQPRRWRRRTGLEEDGGVPERTSEAERAFTERISRVCSRSAVTQL